MAILTIIQKKRRMMPMLPHKILIGGKCIGLMRTPMIHINMPQGLYEITIQSLFPFIKTSAIVKVEEEVDNVMEFEDKEKYWDILFSFDMLLWIVSLFYHLIHIKKQKQSFATTHFFINFVTWKIWLNIQQDLSRSIIA